VFKKTVTKIKKILTCVPRNCYVIVVKDGLELGPLQILQRLHQNTRDAQNGNDLHVQALQVYWGWRWLRSEHPEDLLQWVFVTRGSRVKEK